MDQLMVIIILLLASIAANMILCAWLLMNICKSILCDDSEEKNA